MDDVEGQGVFADLSERLGVPNSAGGSLHTRRGAGNNMNLGSLKTAALEPRSDNLAYIRKMTQSSNKGSGRMFTPIKVRA